MALVDEVKRVQDISGDVRMRAMQQRPLSQIAAENVWRDTAANTPKPGAAPAPQAAPTTTSAPKVSGASRLVTGLGGLAAGAGIGGAVQSIADNSTGYRDEFENRTGVRGLAGDALRTLGAVGDAATFGLATKFGQGLASATNGGSFMQGFNEPTMREQFAERTGAKPAASPAVSDPYADEGQRGAAANAPSGLASVPDTATTQKQALPVGYRVSDTSVSGVKRVDGGSSPMFTNIDPGQAVSEIKGMKSGTGTIGADGSNFSLSGGKLYQGRFVNSGYEGAGVAPNTDPAFREQASRDFIGYENRRWANDFNQEAQRRLAEVQEYQGWAPGGPGAIAQQYRVDKNGDLQGYEIDKKGQQYAMGARQEAAQRYSDAQRGTPQSGPSLYGQAQAGKYNQSRIALDQQEAGTRALTAGINYRKSQAEMAEMERIGKLRDAYMAEPEGSPKREQIGRALLMLQGKGQSQPRDEETKARYGLITELVKSYSAMPPIGPDGKPVPFKQYAAPALQLASGDRGGQQADPMQQEGARLQGKDGKTYVVRNGVPVPE